MVEYECGECKIFFPKGTLFQVGKCCVVITFVNVLLVSFVFAYR
jgi:hypothetical protein